MDVYFQSEIGVCDQFLPKQKEPVSIVISPLRVEGTEGHLKIVNGCNMWLGCEQKNCYYSQAARALAKLHNPTKSNQKQK